MDEIPGGYNEIRMFLFFKSFVGKEIKKVILAVVKETRMKWKGLDKIYATKVNTKYGSMKARSNRDYKLHSEYGIIKKVANELNFSYTFLKDFVINNKLSFGERDLIYLSSPTSTIKDPGMFIRVDKFATKKQVESAYDEIVKRRLSQDKTLVSLKKKRSQTGIDDGNKLKIYLEVERHITEGYKLKNPSSGVAEEYINSTPLQIAIEIVASNRKISDPTMIRGIHYDVITNYRLPKLTDIDKIKAELHVI